MRRCKKERKSSSRGGGLCLFYKWELGSFKMSECLGNSQEKERKRNIHYTHEVQWREYPK